MQTIYVGPAPRLAVSVAGDGPLVLFLHGIGGNRHRWTQQVEFFSSRFTAAAGTHAATATRTTMKGRCSSMCSPPTAQDRAEPMERISVPTLVITGDEDSVYPPALARAMAQRIPNARFVELSGCGHLSNLDQPTLFNDEVLGFRKALSR